MAPPISDAVVVDVLRRVDRLWAPLVARLDRPPALPEAERAHWWATSVGRVAAVASAAPRFAGKLADLLPLQNTVGAAVQSLVVLGVAAEHGMTDPAGRVGLLSRVLLGRALTAGQVEPLLARQKGAYADEVLARRDGKASVPRTVWRVARLLSRIDGALDARPKGGLGARTLSNLPVVGVVGGYQAERVALRRAAETAYADLSGVPSRR